MKASKNSETGILEIMYPAKLVNVSNTVRRTDNEKQTPYRLCRAEVEYPNGTTAVVGAMLWDASYELFPDEFTKGNDITLRVQVEGDYAGNAVVQLPSAPKFDLSMVEFAEEVLEQA